MRLSVIIPVYKAETTLKRCVDSILSQPFADWEMILVDDGSPDTSGRICDDYAKADERIKVIHQKNAGVSAARNRGLEAATGEYVSFIDSDDWLEGDCFSLVQDTEDDLIVFESITYRPGGVRESWYSIDEKRIDSPDAITGFIQEYINVFVLDGPCGKFFKRSVIGATRFPVGQPLGEDNVFMLSFIGGCKTVALKRGFYYVIEDNCENRYKKYMMPASVAVMCLENIMAAYQSLGISVPSFENRMFQMFFFVMNRESDYACWYRSSVVKNLERTYLGSAPCSFRVLYNMGRNRITRNLGYQVYWAYSKLRSKR